MLTVFCGSGLVPWVPDAPEARDLLRRAVWVDALNPTPEEVRAINAELGIDLPTRGEASEIEISSRLYVENGSAFMTATVMVGADTPHPETGPVTFAFQPQRLVTLRFSEPRPFATFPRRLARTPPAQLTAQKLFLGLLDEIVDRVADILEAVGADLNSISRSIFSEDATAGRVDYEAGLTRIGRNGELAANARESLVTVSRMLGFFGEALPGVAPSELLDEHAKPLARDVAALMDHATFLSNKVNFFLDATLGHINTEQNKVVKIFSVLAVIFLPPTLVANIYGMNFQHMPELGWNSGYPLALLVMLASAILPYLLFKHKKWL